MNISLNTLLNVDGDVYRVVGMITYRNLSDGAVWDEYRLMSVNSGREKWLSIDDTYQEYSISEMTGNRNIGTYHRVDSGTEEVIAARGNVDVDIGEQASFEEYEDSTEEKIFSVEVWSDGAEYSRGYYLDYDEIQPVNDSEAASSFENPYANSYTSSYSGDSYAHNELKEKLKKVISCIFVILTIGLFGLFSLGSDLNISFVPKISSYLKKSSGYTYVTSITGNEKQKADVYKSSSDLDSTVKDIISAIEGKTLNVRQNTEDDDPSVGILTKKEYCLVYISEDNDVLVQISNRKYAYTNDRTPYHSTPHTHRYYRRFYRSTGYADDLAAYRNISSPYSSYSDTTIDTSGSDMYDVYSSYSRSVRQDSINSRRSSGGGSSSGK